jgi:hypothetical protein
MRVLDNDENQEVDQKAHEIENGNECIRRDAPVKLKTEATATEGNER